MDDPRALLAARQRDLLAAVVVGDQPPAGFAAGRLATFRRELLRKRALAVSAAWPLLARALGGEFTDTFLEYAERDCGRVPADPVVDGRLLARWLGNRGCLPDVGRVQALSFDLHFALCSSGLLVRRYPAIRVARLRNPPHLVVAWRLPRLGTRMLLVPLSARRLLAGGSRSACGREKQER